MTERDRGPVPDSRDPGMEPAGSHAGTGASANARSEGIGTREGGPDAERDQSGLGAETASGEGGWRGSEPAQTEAGGLGRGDTGSLGSGGAAASQGAAGQASWDEQSAGQTGGAQGQELVVGGESWEGRDRDTGQGGWTTGDAGFGGRTGDDGGPQVDDTSSEATDPRVDRS